MAKLIYSIRKPIYTDMIKFIFTVFFLQTLLLVSAQSSKVKYWLTLPNQSALLQENELILQNIEPDIKLPIIRLDKHTRFQVMDGYGYTLTGGSAQLINSLDPKRKMKLLTELFGNTNTSIGISYLRIAVGASDLSARVFSYLDLPKGQTDTSLQYFNLSDDTLHLIPLLKQIKRIQPAIKIMATPWSPPVWMKSNDVSKGGNLKREYFHTYAKYLVKYLKTMEKLGLQVDAMTIQNEPEHGGNNPSMLMTADEQALFIKHHLGPLFQQQKVKTKIIIYDHNADHPHYPIQVLNDTVARKYIDGTAFHLYAGDISALSQVKQAHPDKNIYFTEQWTGKNGDFGGDLQWHIKNVIIGSALNHSKIALEWNLANDESFGPHTPGGCTACKGALTIADNQIIRNVSYYIIAHASKWVKPGSVRIANSTVQGLPAVSFLRPDNTIVLIILNETSLEKTFQVQMNKSFFTSKLPAGAVATFQIK